VAGSATPVEVTATGVGRYSPSIEATAYFCCLEAVQNATKHSGAARIVIDVCGRFDAAGVGNIELTVTDDGHGFQSDCTTGNGLANIRDRIESVQGTITIQSATGQGTTVRALIPTARTQGSAGTSSGRQAPDRLPMTVPAAGA
jgi:signal transduction histidine kinase